MTIKIRKSFICGIKGTSISDKEYRFIKKYKPWGVILFSRNIRNIKQVSKLTKSIKKIFNDPLYPILIDEEGGRVSRLKNIADNSIFTAKFFGDLYKKNVKKFNLYYKVYVDQISYVLNLIGVNINTVPVLDLRRSFSHKIIGDRAYSSDKKIIHNKGNTTISLYCSLILMLFLKEKQHEKTYKERRYERNERNERNGSNGYSLFVSRIIQ